jgi:hypothetical protein
VTKYNIHADLLRRVKRACKLAKIPWQPIAARPATAADFCEAVELAALRNLLFPTKK